MEVARNDYTPETEASSCFEKYLRKYLIEIYFFLARILLRARILRTDGGEILCALALFRYDSTREPRVTTLRSIPNTFERSSSRSIASNTSEERSFARAWN